MPLNEKAVREHYVTLQWLGADDSLLAIARQVALESGIVIEPPRRLVPVYRKAVSH